MSEADSPADASTERYEARTLLGRGGMGAVYRAVDRQSGETFALKRLIKPSNERKHDQLVELFHQEFRTLAQLAHPQVVRAHDYGVDAHGPYYTMELLEGEALHDLSPLPWRTACSLLRDVCSAVALLHSRRLLHRDLSPKNIQRTRDGRAKLIDFGAMTPVGQVANVVGTPPLLPPEALLQQPLDGRADLYALGATLYYALTGVHAYPARHFAQLRDVWRTLPSPPSRSVPDVPPGLDALVMSLLSHDVSARPRSATEVIDLLTAIAGLGQDEQLAVSHAYLLTPELAGRAAQLGSVRKRIDALSCGRGGALVLQGAPGMGRSRMLDTTVLEAKLAGLVVARASAADAAGGAYGVVSVLLQQLMETTPRASRMSLVELEALSVLHKGAITPEVDAQRRGALHAAVIAFVRAVGRTQPILLAVDDLDRCDEPSQALLASAMQVCKRERVLIALTCGIERARDAPALALLRAGGTQVTLTAFESADTEALLSSVFGDVPHVASLAARVHARAEASPRGCMELAEYLKDRGLVRYRAGSWELPPAIEDDELPSSLSSARSMRLHALGADARELAYALAVAEGSGLDFSAYAELTAHAELDRVRLAIDELLLAQVLRCEGMHYTFEARAWAIELRDGLAPSELRAICVRIAEALARRHGDRLDVARYLWRAEEKARTIEVLLAELAQGSRWDRYREDYAEILLGALTACSELGRARHDAFVLRHELIRCSHDLTLPNMHFHLAELFVQLRRESGLDDWDGLDPELDPLTRLQRSFDLAQRRHDGADARDRGLPPAAAIEVLLRLVAESAGVGAQLGDASIVGLFPPLRAFYPISPAIERLERFMIPACSHVIAGRYERARALYLEALSHFVARNELPGVDAATREWGVCALQYALGCIDGGLGSPQALQYAAALERSPRWVVPAYSVRRIYHLMMGNHRQAERCRKHIEFLMLQSPVKPPLSAGAVHQHLFSFSMADDLTGMIRAIPDMEVLSRLHPALVPQLAFARAEVARICGDFEGALALLDSVKIEPGMHPVWPWVAGARLHALLGLGRAQEAHALGLREHAVAESLGLEVISDHLETPLALAEAKLGDFAGATARLDRIIAQRAAWSAQGVLLGWAYEARARVATWMGDAEGFERFAQLCAQQFKKSEGDPALAAKYERLMLEARTAGISVRSELTDALASSGSTAPTSATFASTVGAALDTLAACATIKERAQHALALLINSAGALHGELYLCGDLGIRAVAASLAGLSDDHVHETLTHMVERAQFDDETAEYTATLAFQAPPHPGLEPRLVWPMLLTTTRDGETSVVGVAALHFAVDQPARVPFELASATADALIQAGDVSTHAMARTEVARPR